MTLLTAAYSERAFRFLKSGRTSPIKYNEPVTTTIPFREHPSQAALSASFGLEWTCTSFA